MTARTAYGLDAPRGAHWAENAACGSPLVDPEWWWPENGPLSIDGRRALHICRAHCPGRAGCARAADEKPPRFPCVQGGRRYVERSGGGVQRSKLTEPTSAVGCPYCAGEA